ncbi:MAG: class I SAM-dependent methyltransferase [Verrucomicrobiota bacterium]
MDSTLISKIPNWSESLLDQVREYYMDYYHRELGIPSWESNVNARLNEERLFAIPNIERISRWCPMELVGKKVLIVGGGTGAEMVILHLMGCDVTVIEPYAPAVEILREKARVVGISQDQIHQLGAEKMSFDSGSFEFIYCFTVLEHVQHVGHSLDEMCRVLAVDGWLYLVTPDYRQVFEPHYKVWILPFSPRWLMALQLKLRGRKTDFLYTLQLVNSRKLMKYFQRQPVEAMQIIHSWPQAILSSTKIAEKFLVCLADYLSIQRDQYWLVRKLPQKR